MIKLYKKLFRVVSLYILIFLLTPVLFASSAKPLFSYPAVLHENVTWADGDSFMVVMDDHGAKREEVIRLYYVDCLETQASGDSGKRRVRAQFCYFGLSGGRDALFFGRLAKKRVSELLAKPFTVHTAGSRAMGRSKKPRIYGMVTLYDGRDLAAVLVEEGLARVYGVKKTMPDGTKSGEYNAYLKDLELSAAVRKKGAWAKSDPQKLVKMRAQERKDAKELDDVLEGGVFSPLSEKNRIDLNTATLEELKQLRGVGDVTGKRIIAGRPYSRIEDLAKISGIGPKILKKMSPFVTVKSNE